MESKLMIDITDHGDPFIFVDFKASEDLRDKVIGRLLTRLSAFNVEPPVAPLIFHVLYYDPEKQRLQAMIETPSEKG